MPQGDDLVILIRKSDTRVVIVGAHIVIAVVHQKHGDQFVVRMRKRRERLIPVLSHFVMEMVEDQLFSSGTDFRRDHAPNNATPRAPELIARASEVATRLPTD